MIINKKGEGIELPIISGEALRVIQKGVLARDFEAFNKLVVAPVDTQINNWVQQLYPDLITDTDDLKLGVFRRLKNEIKKVDADYGQFKLEALALKFLRLECEASLPTEKNIKNNLGLTKTQFKTLVQQLKDGDETIIEKIYLAHFEKCAAIVAKHSSCSKEMAFECTMDALLEIRTDLQKGRIRYGNLESYITSRAVNKFYKKDRKKKIKAQPLSDGMEFFNAEEDVDHLVEKDLKSMVQNAIAKLCSECQQIIKLFYYQDVKMNEIGNEMNKSHEAIRKQASRCRTKLKKYIGEKFYKEFSNHFS